MKDIYKSMNSQDILRNLGISVDVELDNSETYDYEIAGFNNDYDPKLLDFTNSITFDTPILKDLSDDDSTIENIKLCEFDNRINDINYIYSSLTVTFNYDEFTDHFNILDSEGNVVHDYENFILNNDLFTYTGIPGEIHYFMICDYSTISGETDSPPSSSTYSIKFDLDNNGLGEIYNNGYGTLSQSIKTVWGDFKVRTAEYGTFETNPSSLEEVVVHSYLYDKNNGNVTGWHPTLQSNTPELEGNHYHFAGGVSKQASEKIIDLIIKDEFGESVIGDVSIFKEDSISDWTVGMSIYKDSIGTSIMDGVVTSDGMSPVQGSSWDRYHFIAKNQNGEWTLIRSTDGIVTHIEVVKDTNYLKYQELYTVGIVTVPYDNSPQGWTEYQTWFDEKVNDSANTVMVNYSNSASRTMAYRRTFQYTNGIIGAIGTPILTRTAGKNVGLVYHEYLSGYTLEPETEGTNQQFSNSALTIDENRFLLTRVDLTTGLVVDRVWYSIT